MPNLTRSEQIERSTALVKPIAALQNLAAEIRSAEAESGIQILLLMNVEIEELQAQLSALAADYGD